MLSAKDMAETVAETVKANLCVSCGACGRVCGANAIRETYRDGMFVPEIEAGKCTHCGTCLKVCPSAPTDVPSFYGTLDFDGPAPRATYEVCARDAAVRMQSASGGFVSALLSCLLSRGLYARAYVLTFENFLGRKAEILPVKTTEGVTAAVRSKYIPAGIGSVVEAIRERRIAESIVVCTPCQLLAIRKAMRLYGVPEDNVLFVGLFCDSIFDYRIYSHYANCFGAFNVLHFKDKSAGGWPGDTLLVHNAERTIIDRRVRMSLKDKFRVERCKFCFDKLNKLADISAGDCYVPGSECREGNSSVLLRTEAGERAFEACRDVLHVRPAIFEAVKRAQNLEARRQNLTAGVREAGIHVGVAAPSLPARTRHNRAFRVLIDVEGFANRGDQLMLEACLRQVHARLPGATVAIPLKAWLEDPSWCVARRILPLQKSEQKISRRLRQRLNRFIYGHIMHRTGFVLPDEIDIILFAAGFNYGDPFAEMYTDQNIKDEVAYYASFTKKDRKFVLMPQALGPFKTPRAKEKMLRLYPYVDLIYAREPASFTNILEILPDARNIRTAPDFTCLCEPTDASIRLAEKSYVVLVPNMRMMDRTPADVAHGYMNFCVQLVHALLGHNETVILLNHEGPDDETLCHEINAHFGNRLPILSGLSGLTCKAVISRAKLVVSSRFHGVVSGLVEGVPTLCTSWSHKYGELLKEHGRPNNALDVRNPESAVATVLEALKHPADHTSAPGRVEAIRKRTTEMWDEIFSLLPREASDCCEPKYKLF